MNWYYLNKCIRGLWHLLLLVLLDTNFKYEPYLSNGCHYLTQKAISFNEVAIVSVKGSSFLVYEQKL